MRRAILVFGAVVVVAVAAWLVARFVGLEDARSGRVSSSGPAVDEAATPAPRREYDDAGARRDLAALAPEDVVATSTPFANDEPGSIVLTVVDAKGAPAFDREVVRLVDGMIAARAETDGDGRCRFGDLDKGRHVVVVSPCDHHLVEISEASPHREVTVKLRDPIVISGRVVEASGGPAAGAAIVLHATMIDALTFEVAESEADGSFSFDYDSAAPPFFSLTARLDGRGEAEPVSLMAPIEPVVLVLTEIGGTVSIRVSRPEGAALPRDVRVALLDDGPTETIAPGAETRTLRPSRVALLDGAGEVTFTSLPIGEYTCAVSAPGFAVRSESFTMAGRETIRRELVLGAGGRLAGRVTCVDGPLAGASVNWTGPRDLSAFSAATTTDAEGRFTLPFLPPGNLAITVEQGTARQAFRVAILDAETTEVAFVLKGIFRLVGRCVDDLGVGVADLPVKIARSSMRPPHVWLRTDSEGHFESALDDASHTVVVHDAGGATQLASRSWKPGDGELHIVIPAAQRPAGRIIGRLVGTDESPLVGKAVAGFIEPEGLPGFEIAPIAVEDGAFEIVRLPAGPVTLSVATREKGKKAVASVEVDPGETVDLGTIVVDWAFASLQFDLDLAEGIQPSGIGLRLVGAFETVPLTPSAHGVTHGLIPGDHVLVVSGADFSPRALPVHLVADETTRIAVSVRPDGIPCDFTWTAGPSASARAYTLTVAPAGTPDFPLIVSQGALRADAPVTSRHRLEPGDYLVTVQERGGRKARASFVVAADDEVVKVSLNPR